MQAIGAFSRTSQVQPQVPEDDLKSQQIDWMTMYRRRPSGNSTLFELEAMVAKRMGLLAWIDDLMNAPQAKNFDDVLDEIGARLPEERKSRGSAYMRNKGTVLGVLDDPSTSKSATRRSGSRGAATFSSEPAVTFGPEEDLISHLLSRYAFCTSDRWRKWMVRVEETLLRARLRLEMAKDPLHFLPELLKRNNLPCTALSQEQQEDPVVQEYLEYRAYKAGQTAEPERRAQNYYSVPARLATRLVKTRSVLCRRGDAILFRDQIVEVFITIFRSQLDRGIHEAWQARVKVQNLEEESEQSTVVAMLDAFLESFIADPTDSLAEGEAGSVRAGDVPYLAQTHFPLCMRQIDQHLRREGHLKHSGRFTYGLFLKAIGLTLDDSMTLFASLLTQKGGGSVEAFAKSTYGYNVRHNYGMEGKKTSYSSATCGTILGLPPTVDRNDCHGCPFRFRDEAVLRQMLQKDQLSPLGKGFPDVHASPADIEDIVSDAKRQHYTRACYKYFMATHPNVKRDTLFRSPYEYYCCSRETETRVSDEGQAPAQDGTAPARTSVGSKRSESEPFLREDVTRPRQ